MSGDVGNERQNGAPDFRFLTQVANSLAVGGRTVYYSNTSSGAFSTTAPAWAQSAIVVLVGGGSGPILATYYSSPTKMYTGGQSGAGGGGIFAFLPNVAGLVFAGSIGAGGAAGNSGGATTLTNPYTGSGDIAKAWGGQYATSPDSGGVGGLINSSPYFHFSIPGQPGIPELIECNWTSISGTVACTANAPINNLTNGGMPGLIIPPPASFASFPSGIPGRGGNVRSYAGTSTSGNAGGVCIWWCY